MKILVDTSIWSLALRRESSKNFNIKTELSEIIKEVRVQIIGPIRQEILSGIKTEKQFGDLKRYLSFFPDLAMAMGDFELAAEFSNICRTNGIQGSNTDFLICAVAVNNNLEIFSNDKDFKSYEKYLFIKLYKPRFFSGV